MGAALPRSTVVVPRVIHEFLHLFGIADIDIMHFAEITIDDRAS